MKPLSKYGIHEELILFKPCFHIYNMIQERDRIFDRIESEEPVDIDDTSYEPVFESEVYHLKNLIFEDLMIVREVAPIDFILETLDSLGIALSLINDDDGHWAVSSEGIQSVNMGNAPSDFCASMFVKKEEFFDSIREAIVKFLEGVDE